MEKTIEIRNWKTGDVIFSYTCENNTVKKTVEEAVKQGVSLAYANLTYCNLSEANLSFAGLSHANLKDTNLANTNLSYADLSHAILTYTDLSDTDLREANLNYACLGCANLNSTNLANTNLFGADFFHSDLSNVILNNVKGLNDQCPKTGSFIGWKKCVGDDGNFYIVKLEIPSDAKRSSATTNKCRCSKAKVLKIQTLDGTKTDVDEVYSWYNFIFKYRIGEIVEVPDFDEHYWKECASGIHFFMNKEDALNFIL